MIIVVLDFLPDSLLDRLLADNFVYRPDLLRKTPSIVGSSLISHRADAIVTRAEVPPEVINNWAANRSSPTYWVRVNVGHEAASAGTAERPIGPKCLLLEAFGDCENSAYIAAFELLEQRSTRQLLPPPSSMRSGDFSSQPRVLLIGAGLLNLITAHTLQRAGYQLEFIDSGPDPREGADWTAYGCSRGGDDARMFTLSEMNCRGSGSSNYPDRQISITMNSQFRHSVSSNGWNVRREATSSRDEERWVEEFECLPLWLAHRYNEDTFAFNRESHLLWQEWIRAEPSLFASSNLRDGILRVFADHDHFERKIHIQERIGATRRVLSPSEIAREHPALAEAVALGNIVGGIDGIGFTLRAHEFMHLLLDALTRGGAKFSWRQAVHRLVKDSQGRIRSIETAGTRIEASHYVISPGAYGNALLEGCHSHNRIHGMLGVWLTLPNVDPALTQSIKISGTGYTCSAANVALSVSSAGAPTLVFGSGYGHTGLNPRNIDEALLGRMFAGLAATAERNFPVAYRRASDDHQLEPTFRYCVRPWTATGLGVFEILETTGSGKCVITGGHNTGGFAQAPAVAAAVLAALEEREHPMHRLYHPDRASAFLGGVAA